ncbi:MAG: acyl-CoA dehydrogenase [Betaproteobacteria bacterium]|nr:acyl-CoA dehydrogenase [Betaproteobacteria bacterium]
MTEAGHILSTTDEVAMLRDSARNFFAEEWPPDRAVAASKDSANIRRVWEQMGRQGWLALGADPESGGLRFATVLLQELGRAGCPAPMVDAFLANVLFASATSGQAQVGRLSDALRDGSASISLILGENDGDANAGRISQSSNAGTPLLSGQAAFVEGTATATHLLASTDQAGAFALIDAGHPNVHIHETPGFIAPFLAEIALDRVPATMIETRIAEPRDLARLARLCLVARSLGAATRGFEMVVDYAKIRTQFGKKIGQFQAIQHKLANVMINVETAKLVLWRAAGSYDRGDPDWRYAAGAAVSVASPALRQACLETHHAFGGVSFWEEHEMPRHFRRIHADLTRCGGVHAAREDVAHALLDTA